jgi:sulfotransferase family protein
LSLVEITEVAPGEAHEALVAHALDTPAPGQRLAFFGIDVRGWAIGRNSPAERALLRVDGVDLREGPSTGERRDVGEHHPGEWSDRSGFFLPVGALRLPREFELALRVRLEDGVEVDLATISGSRSALATGFVPSLEPVCLTALGRTGSTAVTRLLSAHPRIAAYRPFEYEPRVVTYWMDALLDLAEPAAFRRQINPSGPLRDHWWAGDGDELPRRLVDEEIQGWLGGESIAELAAFCQARIDGLYRVVAERFERPEATHFVEKLGPETGALVRELYPRARELFLVRDFRDVVASIFAYNEKRGFEGFGRARVASNVEYVSALLSESAASFVRAWRARGSGAHLIRYEDVVQQPRETLTGVLEFLGVDAEPGTVDAMVATLTEPASDVHRTTAAEDSIGRWRRDLADDVQAACREAFGEALDEFGYAP